MENEPIVSLEETIETNELRAFVCVAEQKSVTGAARRLGVTKSTVSKTLSGLEARLGVTLFERSSRRISITAAGSMLLPRAQSVLQELSHLAGDLSRSRDEVRGQLTVAAPPDLAKILTAELFPAFLQKYAEVTLRLRLDYGYVDLQDPELDAAIRVGQVRDERLVARKVAAVVRILVASPNLAARLKLCTPEDLTNAPALVFSEAAPALKWALKSRRRRADVAVTGRLCARSFPVLLQAAEQGLGVLLVPEILATDALASGQLVRVLPDWEQEEAPVYLVHRVGHSKIRRVAVFLQFVKEHLDEHSLDRV